MSAHVALCCWACCTPAAWTTQRLTRRFDLGGTPPRVKGIKIYPSDQTGDDVVMEVDAVWASSMVAILKVPLLALPTLEHA